MFYKKNQAPRLSDELFKNPTAEYRGTPFWAWNGHPEAEELTRQIEAFREMGFGGFHMHVRSGMDVEYLTPEFFASIRHCVDEAVRLDMLAYLYDEDRWPSGAVGGKLTKDVSKRQQHLLWTKTPYCGKTHKTPETGSGSHFYERSENGTLLAAYDVKLNADGTLASYKKIGKDDEAEGMKWYAYVETPSPNPWYNGQTYADILNPEVTREFVQMTHEAYKREVGDQFDKAIPSIFCDEPQTATKHCLTSPTEGDDATMPWTVNLAEDFAKAEGMDLLAGLPEIFWDLPEEKPSVLRWKFHDYLAERFADGFAGICGKWCEENGIALTGHVMREPTLQSQTGSTGETMRSYRSFTIPGIDMLVNAYEYTTAKQCQSAVRQYGREAMVSELYGITGWNCGFTDYKRQGDWQAALGVTVRVPHLSFMTMRGEAKRDYPASFNYQSPWYKDFPLVEDHFARVHTATTRGKAAPRVAVVHPVESYWLAFGPNGEGAARKEWLENSFLSLTDWLLFGGIDFDFISEALLPDLCSKASAPMQVGKMQYDAIIIPPMLTLKDSTVERLTDFARAGGELIFTCEKPPYCNAVPSDAIDEAYALAKKIPFEKQAILDAIDAYKPLEILVDGKPNELLLYNLREDNDCKWIFLAQGRRDRYEGAKAVHVALRGEYLVEEYDTATGEHRPLPVFYANGKTHFLRAMYDCDSILIRLTEVASTKTPVALGDTFAYKKAEPNVLLLDAAEYAVDGGEYAPRTELLRALNICRVQVGMEERKLGILQPWAVGKEVFKHTLSLRFRVQCDVADVKAHLGVELTEDTSIKWNGKELSLTPDGYYTDRSIVTLPLPEMKVGENILEISYPFGEATNAEWCYILGDFGVKVEGDTARIIKAPDAITLGDLGPQGLPFYGGMLSLDSKIKTNGGDLKITFPAFGATFVRVLIDGKEYGVAAYPPFSVSIPDLAAGEHAITLELCIPRVNAFGPVHHIKGSGAKAAPKSWRTEDDRWSDDYRLTVQGLTAAPIVEEITK